MVLGLTGAFVLVGAASVIMLATHNDSQTFHQGISEDAMSYNLR
jgi:hypothetical protein